MPLDLPANGRPQPGARSGSAAAEAAILSKDLGFVGRVRRSQNLMHRRQSRSHLADVVRRCSGDCFDRLQGHVRPILELRSLREYESLTSGRPLGHQGRPPRKGSAFLSVVVAGVGAAGVRRSDVDRDIVAVLAPIEPSAKDSEVGFANAILDDCGVSTPG